VEKPDDLLRDVGRKIREFRVAHGWTQEKMAELLGIALRNYQEIERGRQNLTIRTMARLAALLGVKTARLMDEPKSRVVPKGRPRKE
jgi:transcriptional regulator with XRE-family HTH domain